MGESLVRASLKGSVIGHAIDYGDFISHQHLKLLQSDTTIKITPIIKIAPIEALAL